MARTSVIVPCYRYAHFLTGCVNSVRSQEGVDLRVLIIDDASPDNTPEVAAELSALDPRIEYLRHKENRKNIYTYNEGIEWADGDYTLLLSADDMLTPGALKRATALLDHHPEVAFAYGRAIKFYGDSQALPEPRIPPTPEWDVRPGLEWLEQRCRDGWYSSQHRLISPEAVMRTSLVKRLGGFRPELPVAGDVELWMRLAVHGAVGFLPRTDQAYYRVHNANMHLKVLQDPLLETRQRKAAFDTVFREWGDRIPNASSLLEMAHRKVAADAIAAGCEMFDSGAIQRNALAEFLAFAKSTSARSRGHFGIRARQVLGASAFRVLQGLVAKVSGTVTAARPKSAVPPHS